ncbi:F-box protein (DUF295) [Rhynchospora pubera]|uniref:F-box protein (DUF295) n=1 Tax=Rhynchospora pubera TaxID=906938 RepID=A0AAV8GQN0_9POAL|nr:F-box protein (DUF295) [Rhynchospora pubera]
MGKPARDWSDLPPEILHLICKKLPDIYDFTVFHSVCKTWRSIECDPPLQLPWILEHRTMCDDPALSCYSLTSEKIHTITCPRSLGKCFLGPSYHYLLTYRVTKAGYSWSLLNPLTGNDVHLPSLEEDMMYWVEWIGSDKSGEHVVFSEISHHSRGYNWSNTIVLRQIGDHNTVQFPLEGSSGNGKLYRNEEFFFIDVITGVTKVMNIRTQKLVYEVPSIVRSHYDRQFWMVESGGEILHLSKTRGVNLDDLHFDIYRLDLGSGKRRACWVKIDSIGDQVLFLDEHRGVSFCASDYEGLGENCIYFLAKLFLCKYDIKDGAAKELHCPFVGKDRTWFTPRLY